MFLTASGSPLDKAVLVLMVVLLLSGLLVPGTATDKPEFDYLEVVSLGLITLGAASRRRFER